MLHQRNPSQGEIQTLRETFCLTREQAAMLIHCNGADWSDWEEGKRKMHPAYWELFRMKAAQQVKPVSVFALWSLLNDLAEENGTYRLSEIRLNKLIYLCREESLKHGTNILDPKYTFKTWSTGPVLEEVQYLLKQFKKDQIKSNVKYLAGIHDTEVHPFIKQIVKTVFDANKNMTAPALIDACSNIAIHPTAAADYFITLSKGSITALKLIKLTVMAHRWFQELYGKSVFTEAPEDGASGPLMVSVFHDFKHWGINIVTSINGCHGTVPNELKPFFDRIWQVYKGYTDMELWVITAKPLSNGTPLPRYNYYGKLGK